ncbi:serine hydrolase [Nonomuraea sp. NEAU-A123]|uniref:serine hydrolase domain-containing protein n=1 Tax=Nonomuraea sp. NEAU-A123 TaxID=2839649 RepID=UPI001BE4AD29|nr:serine hydrolase [Nonomuraea sp. NEAU-A123]MBT2226158.1 beta-lactamase family protein [Nonomuraea sp. NEAU-A123]
MTLADRVDSVLRAGKAPNLHGLVVVENGQIILERYGAGQDFQLNEPLGHVTFEPDTLHDVRSVTKSVVSLLYGIALAEKLVAPPEEGLLAQFPEYPDLAEDPERARLTVEHALTMTLGLEWDESVPYTSAANSEIAMEYAPDRYRFVLERPVVEEPGQRRTYCGGATALIGRLVAKGTGRSLTEFARGALFEPLGIGEFVWTRGDDGTELAASGLRLAPRDLAAIGTLLLDGGRGIVPRSWIEELSRPRVRIDDESAYSYQWYVGTGAHPWLAAHGNGGQLLHLAPERGLVVAMTAGEYNLESLSSAAVRDAVLQEA